MSTTTFSPLTTAERQRAEAADARGDYGSIDSRIARLADAREAQAQSLEELRARPEARESDIRDREEGLRSYDEELAQLRAHRLVTTEAGRDAAGRLLRGAWDSNGTNSIHLPADLARPLLEARGWRLDGGRWYTPEGNTYYWSAEEALTVELVGEAMSLPGDRA